VKAHSTLDQLERLATVATTALAVAGLLALMLLAAMTLADGVARWLLNRPIQGVRDLAALVIAVAVTCCLPAALIERSNITVRFLPRWSVRGGKLLDLLAAIVVAAVLAVMAWQFKAHAMNIASAGETTWVLRLPTAPFWIAVDAILWCAVLVQLVVVALEAGRLAGRPDKPAAA
jgi:TRAP-type C4-dicarboxylate transport system permease small subunit